MSEARALGEARCVLPLRSEALAWLEGRTRGRLTIIVDL